MILSDFPMFVGVKWLKYSCNVTRTTTYEKWPDPSPNERPTFRVPNGQGHSCYTGYTFSSERGFEGTGHSVRYGKDLSGYYEITPTYVRKFADPVDDGSGNVTFSMVKIDYANEKTTTTYSKGGTGYGAIYADTRELPEDGQLIEGSADGTYCVIKVGGSFYYYEKSI